MSAYMRGVIEGAECVLFIAAIWGFGWMAGAVAAWDINPGHWNSAGRIADVLFCVVCSVAAFLDMRDRS